MFTGIIEDLARVESVEKRAGILCLSVKSAVFTEQKAGDSISVNGACLTISRLKRDTASFDVMEETLKATTLKALKKTDLVNVERALKIGDRLGGHFVTGHIDCVGKIIEKVERSGNFCLKVKIEKGNMKFIVPKGSIALDGISLTVADIGVDNFTVYLIPHTIKNTTLGFKKTGDDLNIEFDLLGKYSLRLKDETIEKSKISEEFLRGKGFC